LFAFLISRFVLFIASKTISPSISMTLLSIHYLLPLCMVAMLIRLVIGLEMALIVSLLVAFFGSLFVDDSIYLGFYFFISGIAGASFISLAKKRIDVIKAGFMTGCMNVITIIFLHFIISFSDKLSEFAAMDLFWNMVLGLSGGLLAAFFGTFMLLIAESVFNYTTDFKLLDLANQITPVLRELMVQAPGTYHHSIIVGSLSEAAADSIGENGLLARVGCLYHDIGKSKKPLYYVENQTYRENKHDRLTPRMSARVIQSHVKDGIEMARHAKLPEEIIDMIPQHHGTRLISFFYNKAKEKADPEVETIDEKDFRYEGPKPQSRVAGIVLLADGLEAITRTLDDPTPARLRGVVRGHINKIFSEGELDETDLTLRDLSGIASAFTRVLTSIFHHRIDYPAVVGKESGARLRKVVDQAHEKGLEKGSKVSHYSDSKSSASESARSAEGEGSDTENSPRLKIT
jgi:hypothetical protein